MGASRLVPLTWGETPSEGPDVEVRADGVEWCFVAGERFARPPISTSRFGGPALSADLLAAVPAFATL